MPASPEISVVMGVYNEGPSLRETIDSILAQEGVTIELIVVNDGSSDNSGAILDEYAVCEPRVRVVHQENQGLTRALVAGCSLARGRYIARQDCGDISLPGRLARLRDILDAAPGAVMAACATRYLGPMNEKLYDIAPSTDELQAGLRRLDIRTVRGPSHHGSTMFRRSAYQQAGGYRPHFRVAQDLDLWMRMSEIGACVAETEVLYEARLVPGAISATRREEQIRTATTILACAEARRSGRGEAEVLRAWDAEMSVRPMPTASARRRSQSSAEARFYYFIACVLRGAHPERSRHYYRKAIRTHVFFIRAWVGLFRSLMSQ